MPDLVGQSRDETERITQLRGLDANRRERLAVWIFAALMQIKTGASVLPIHALQPGLRINEQFESSRVHIHVPCHSHQNCLRVLQTPIVSVGKKLRRGKNDPDFTRSLLPKLFLQPAEAPVDPFLMIFINGADWP